MKKILVIVTAAFFAAMVFLSLFSRDICNSALPHVTASRVQCAQFPFEYTDENRNILVGTESKPAPQKSSLSKRVCAADDTVCGVFPAAGQNNRFDDYRRHAVFCRRAWRDYAELFQLGLYRD